MATPLGTKKSTSVNMADEDASKIDPKNHVDVKYDDIPEAHCQDFEAQLKQQAEEAKMKLLLSY